MITSMSNGYKIEYTGTKWIFSDTKEDITNVRPCKHCGRMQSKEGYDGCLGYLPNVISACCNHGLGKPYVVTNSGEHMEFDSVEELKEYFNQ